MTRRRIVLWSVAGLALLVGVVVAVVCILRPSGSAAKPESEEQPCAAVSEAIRLIGRLESVMNCPGAEDGDSVDYRILDVATLTASRFKRELKAFPGKQVHLWMPSETRWVLTGLTTTNRLSLASVMDDFAADTNCTTTVAELFACYAGTREDILPAFESDLRGEVVPEWFVTTEIPSLDWLDAAGIDEDILRLTLAEIRSMQVVRRLILQGMMASRAGRAEEAVDAWARAHKRNPHDPLLEERLDRMKRNAATLVRIGNLAAAAKCYETLIVIDPTDASSVLNYGICLQRMGRKEMAAEVLKRAKELQK